ncbi:Lrp/AsnC family transcriptional regulator [Pseudomonas sp. NPDC089569]|uniref:Lrp/AsnC family transcriptional regulator n=1 Tax=Pseudomonas sp. NPDC089569 TaxID=3390722 RepID=UPI003D053C62
MQKPSTHSTIRQVTAPETPTFAFDEIDLSLLKVLVSDARLSQRQIAGNLGISAPTVSERMSRLEKAGVIRGYTAEVDWAALGYPLTVFLSVVATPGYDIGDVMSQMWKIPEVQDVLLVTGDLDLLVRLRARDHNHLRNILMDKIWQVTGLQGTATQVSIAEMPAKNFSEQLLQEMEEYQKQARLG